MMHRRTDGFQTCNRHVVCSLILSSALGLGTVCSALGQAAPGDSDLDGVVDSEDACLDTPPGDLVGPDGCSVCPCEEKVDGTTWASRKEYVACVTAEAKRRRSAGTMRVRDMRRAVAAARDATCGDDDLVR